MDKKEREKTAEQAWEELARQIERPFVATVNALARLIDRYPLLGRIPAIPRWLLIGIWTLAAILGAIAKAMQ